MDYISIFKKSWSIVWQNRFLWLLGFFMLLGGGLSWPSGSNESSEEGMSKILEYFYEHMAVSILLLVFAAMVFVGLYVLAISSQAAAIRAICNLKLYSQMKIKSMLREGLAFFWKIFSLELIFAAAIVGIIMIFVVPTAVLFSMKNYIMGSFLGLFAVAILIPVIVGSFYIKKFAIFYSVISGFGIKKAIEDGYNLFMSKIKESIIMGLLMIAMSLLIFIAVFIVIVCFGLVGILAGGALYFIIGEPGAIAAMIVFGMLFLIALVLSCSVFQAWSVTTWTTFFQEIGAIKHEERTEEVKDLLEANNRSAQPEAA